MDTITHGIAGALIGKAVFRGEDMFAGSPVNRGRIITWSLMLGAIFPDSDVIRDFLSSDKLLIVTWHRSLTHSLVLLPLWTLVLAGITRAFLNWRKWEAPSFAALSGIYAVGILSHILLDLVTTFGTMIWSPLEWSRPAWDLIFIVDFTLTAILLLPQFLAWVYSRPEKVNRRAVGMWLVFLPAPFLIARIGEIAGAPISDRVVLGAMVVFAVLILLPARFGWGVKIRHDKWNRAGLAAAVLYVAGTFYAHHVALARIQKFAVLDHLQVESIGALPLPPSLWHWDGLVRTERGVYELRMDLADKTANDGNLLSLEHHYFPDAPPNSYIEVARRLPEVQKVLWFSRFPVTRFHKEGDVAVVEISDLRFPRARPGRPASFTYRVSFGAEGNVLSQGWVTR
jgi:inner membrane protein